jgi:hypothetical protein
MKKSVSVIVALLVGVALGAMLPSAGAQSGGQRTVWYFYRVTWGHQDEFIDLFKRNHYPILKKQLGDRLVGFKAYVPQFHGDGRADWTFATEIVFKSDAQFLGPTGEEAIIRALYPDPVNFRKEEARRFEILDAHWDVPLREVSME